MPMMPCMHTNLRLSHDREGRRASLQCISTQLHCPLTSLQCISTQLHWPLTTRFCQTGSRASRNQIGVCTTGNFPAPSLHGAVILVSFAGHTWMYLSYDAISLPHPIGRGCSMIVWGALHDNPTGSPDSFCNGTFPIGFTHPIDLACPNSVVYRIGFACPNSVVYRIGFACPTENRRRDAAALV